ncbi:type II toxin-antitoxin system HicB family antitoxin [Patescibacteria group bacterium]|nr:type II toxin-antitoxin system HicB family antitoxin [Patescibacteria group bacterium]
MKYYTFRIIIESEKPTGYYGFVPLLKGLHTCGDTIEEVKKNLKEAIKCHIQGLLKDKELIPQEEDVLEAIQSFSEKDFAISRQ